MPQQDLDGPQIRSVFQQVSGEAVPQGVRMDLLPNTGKFGRYKGDDPIPPVADWIAEHAGLLCFDELQVTDIADAMILGRLFKALLEAPIVVVATSNVPPGELYKDGLNRALFLPFIDLIAQHMEVEELLAAKDFRLEKLVGRPLYFTPADERARAEMDRLWKELTGNHPAAWLDPDTNAAGATDIAHYRRIAELAQVTSHTLPLPPSDMLLHRFAFVVAMLLAGTVILGGNV